MASEVSSGTANYQGGEKKTWLGLPPGFRFYPTDEDLVCHSLSHKVPSNRFSCPVDVDVDLYKSEPWDLPSKANMGEQEWYFFSFRDRKYPTTGMRTNRATASGYWPATGKDTEIFRAPIEHQTGVDVSTGDMRFDDCDVNHNKMLWRATLLELLQGMASALECLHSSLDRPIRFRDLKPSNVLLDEKTENQLSDDYTHIHIPRGRAVPTHNGPLDANFSGKPSAERGIEIKIGSHMTRQQTYLCVHHHPLRQMLPSARNWITSKTTFGKIFKGWISAKPKYESFGDIFKGWISGKPKYETPNAGQVSEYIIRKLYGIKNGLTVNGSQQHSEPDSCRSGHGKTAVNTKPSSSSAWIIATAAPHHATGNRNLLSGFIMEHDDQFVHAVNRVPMKVLARGAVVTDAFILPDVWFVPGLTENLVSVSQLAELDHSIGFGRGKCSIRSARDAKIVGEGHLQKSGHYVLDYLKVPLAI